MAVGSGVVGVGVRRGVEVEKQMRIQLFARDLQDVS